MEFKVKEPAEKRLKVTFILVAVLFLLCALMPYIKLPVLPAIIPFLYAVFSCFYLIKYTLPEYIYIIGEETLRIEKGKDYKKQELLNIPLKDILSFKKENVKAKNLTVSPFSKDYMVLTIKKGTATQSFKIHNIKELGAIIYE